MIKHKSICFSALLSFILFFSLSAQAQQNPTVMLQNVSDQMLSRLANMQNRNNHALYALVRRSLVPHIDLNLISKRTLGPYFDRATSLQKTQFKQEFVKFLVRTYAAPLSSYNNQKQRVEFFPVRGGISGKYVTVNSRIIQSSGNVAISYRLVASGNSWKVYDFSVEGVSLVANYRSQFSDVLRTQGLSTLIQKLRAQNRSLA